MKRLTVHLKRVSKIKQKRFETKDGVRNEVLKDIIYNTESHIVKNEEAALKILNQINDGNPKNNVKKWYLSNLK